MSSSAFDHIFEERLVGVAAHAALARLAGPHLDELLDDLGRPVLSLLPLVEGLHRSEPRRLAPARPRRRCRLRAHACRQRRAHSIGLGAVDVKQHRRLQQALGQGLDLAGRDLTIAVGAAARRGGLVVAVEMIRIRPLRLKLPRRFRAGAALAAAFCASMLSYGFWLQYGKGEIPCPLCYIQRGFYIFVMVVLAAYCGFYVLAMREQRAAADGKPKLPCDRC